MATYIVAVSGGVDSAVLLHLLAKTRHKVIVAHVEHGIRDDSAADARFVQALARLYGHPYEETQLNLGPGASEERAREGRYAFLFTLANKYNGVIVTAHHGDDLVESIAINLYRGTGWRGIAVLNREGIERPLLTYTKSQLYDYAVAHRLEWVEDKTNHDKRYLRNRIRAQLYGNVPQQSRDQLRALRDQQVRLLGAVNTEQHRLLAGGEVLRHVFIQIDPQTATELLGEYIKQVTGKRPMMPQLQRALIAIKTAKPGALFQIGSGVNLRFTPRFFSVEVV